MPQNRYGTIKVQENLLSTMSLPNLVSQQFMKYLSIHLNFQSCYILQDRTYNVLYDTLDFIA